jgi:glycosyltransferase involved in cell wall biosynthesis
MKTIVKPKVLMLDTLSGVNDYSISLAYALTSLCNLTFITSTDSKLDFNDSYTLLKVIPSYQNKQNKFKKIFCYFYFIILLVFHMWKHRGHFVHIQFFRVTIIEAPLVLFFKTILSIKLIHTAHNALPHEQKPWHKIFYKIWYRHVNKIQVLGSYSNEKLIEMGVSRDKIYFIPHGNYDLFYKRYPIENIEQVRSIYGASKDDVIFLMYGLIREYKGLDLLIEAFCNTPKDINAYLIVAGGGEEHILEEAQEKINKVGKQLRARLSFGFVEDNVLSDLINVSDVVVFPYKHVYQSGALLLGMTYGKAILASNIEGFKDYITDQDAITFNPNSSKEFTKQILYLTKSVDDRIKLGKQAKLRANSEFGWSTIARKIANLYG